MRRILRWGGRLVLGAVELVVFVIAVLVLVADTRWAHDDIRHRIEAALGRTFPGGVTVRAVEYDVLGRFTARGITIRSLDGKPAIAIGSLELDASLGGLFRNHVAIETLVVEDVAIRLGDAALTKPGDGTPSEPSTWSVDVRQLEVRRGRLEITGSAPITLAGVAVTGTIEIPAGKPLAARLHLAATWVERALPVALDGDVAIGGGVSVPAMTASVGDLRVVASDLVIDRTQPTGTILVDRATPRSIAAIDPRAVVPAELRNLVIAATRSTGTAIQLAISAQLGATRVTGAIRSDLAARTADGFLGADAIDLAMWTNHRTIGNAAAAVALTADRAGARGVIAIRGAASDLPAVDATVFVDTKWADGASNLIALAAGAGDSYAAAIATGSWSKDVVTLADSSRVWAIGKDLGAATNHRLEVNSDGVRVAATLGGTARLVPELDVEIAGLADGLGVAYSSPGNPTLRAGRLSGRFGGKLQHGAITGWTVADAVGVTRGSERLGSARVDAQYRKDKRIAARIVARPAAAAVVVAADALITTGDVVEIALGAHQVTPSSGAAWTGTGGRIVIADDGVRIRGLNTSDGNGSANVAADYSFAGGALAATIDAIGLRASAIAPEFRGTASGSVAISRRGGRWRGDGALDAVALVFDPKFPAIDGRVEIALRDRAVTLTARGSNPGLGSATLVLAVEGPRDVADFTAWRRLERGAVRAATINAKHVDLGGHTSTGGTIDGEVHLVGEQTSTLTVSDVTTPLGIAEGTVTVSPLGSAVTASWNARLSDVGEGDLEVRIAIPRYPFDASAWKQLGRGVVRSVSASFLDIAIDPTKLAKLGVDTPYRGRANVRLAIGVPAMKADLEVDLWNVQGGQLRQPIDVRIEATTDGTGTTACTRIARALDNRRDGCVAARGIRAGVGPLPELLEAMVTKLPVVFSTWLNAPKTALAAAIAGKVTIPSQSAPELLAVFGRAGFDPKRGNVDGEIVIDGTLGKPTGHGAITARGLKQISAIPGRDIPELVELRLGGSWDGTMARADANVVEVRNRKLEATLTVRPDRLADATASLRSNELDLAPIAAFLPGELAASTGVLRGDVAIDGLELGTARFRGVLELDGAQIPLPTAIGTLRNGHVSLQMAATGITGSAHGLLGVCRDPDNVRVKQDCPHNVRIDGIKLPNDLSTLDAKLVVANVAPIGEIEPVIDGTASIKLSRSGREWTGDIHVTNASVFVPPSTGEDLLDADAPDDVYFIENPPPENRAPSVPSRPWLIARVEVDPIQIIVEDEDYRVNAEVISQGLRVLVGDGIGLDGKIVVVHGDAQLYGRRYEIGENELVSFDGTIEPTIDLRLINRSPDLSLIVNVKGKPSDPEFPTLRFEADPPGRYTEAELQGLVFSGSTTADGGTQAKDIAYGVGASVLSRRVANQVNKVLPKQLTLEVLKCEPNTASAGASCTIAKRFLKGKVYVAGKTRLTPRSDENANELSLQYFFRRTVLEAAAGTSGIYGLDFLWRWRR